MINLFYKVFPSSRLTCRQSVLINTVKTIRSIFSCLSTAEILQANDSLTHVINLYKQQVKGEIVNGNNTLNTQKQTGGWSIEHRNTWILNKVVLQSVQKYLMQKSFCFSQYLNEQAWIHFFFYRRRDGTARSVRIGHITTVSSVLPRVSHSHRQPQRPLARDGDQSPWRWAHVTR